MRSKIRTVLFVIVEKLTLPCGDYALDFEDRREAVGVILEDRDCLRVFSGRLALDTVVLDLISALYELDQRDVLGTQRFGH